MNRMIVWAMMLIATIATTASCSSDNDGNDTLSANDKAQMYGHYQSLAIYGDNITTSAIDVKCQRIMLSLRCPWSRFYPLSCRKQTDWMRLWLR